MTENVALEPGIDVAAPRCPNPAQIHPRLKSRAITG